MASMGSLSLPSIEVYLILLIIIVRSLSQYNPRLGVKLVHPVSTHQLTEVFQCQLDKGNFREYNL